MDLDKSCGREETVHYGGCSPSSFTASSPLDLGSSNCNLSSCVLEVLNAVATKKQWDTEANPRVSAVEAESARVGVIQNFEFHVHIGGGATLILKFPEETEGWRKAEKGEVEFEQDLVALDVGSR